ncbi:MAG: hypothetical protein QM622_02725 [Microbacterium sp.]
MIWGLLYTDDELESDVESLAADLSAVDGIESQIIESNTLSGTIGITYRPVGGTTAAAALATVTAHVRAVAARQEVFPDVVITVDPDAAAEAAADLPELRAVGG